jgi:hypothetical protein
MAADLGEQSFVMIFRPELLIGLAPKTLSGSFRVEDVEYVSVDENHLTAFCDRVIDHENELVGINISPVSEFAERLVIGVRRAPYVTSESGAFQVWFTESPLEGVRNSGEQAFGGQVFRNPAGDLALSIDAGFLFMVADEPRLKNAHARWATISPV